jgi:hypothetical protein
MGDATEIYQDMASTKRSNPAFAHAENLDELLPESVIARPVIAKLCNLARQKFHVGEENFASPRWLKPIRQHFLGAGVPFEIIDRIYLDKALEIFAPPPVGNSVAMPPEKASPGQRRTFDEDSFTITLNGRRFPHIDPKAFRLYRLLDQSRDSMTQAQIADVLAGFHGDKAVTRTIAKLPIRLQRTFQSGPNGFWIVLPRR